MIITAKFASVCPGCSRRILVGEKVEWSRGSRACHAACAGQPVATVVAPSGRSRVRRAGPWAGAAASVPGYASWCTDRPGCGCYDCAS